MVVYYWLIGVLNADKLRLDHLGGNMNEEPSELTNLWLLTEERPKNNIVTNLLNIYIETRPMADLVISDDMKVIPVFKSAVFLGLYIVQGATFNKRPIYIIIISGESSFVDYLFFETIEKPRLSDTPTMAIEVTKTNDKESRNTGAYQRITKFVYIDEFYPKTQKIMYYDHIAQAAKKTSSTSIFGTRMLETLGVEIYVNSKKKPSLGGFSSIKELIEEKNKMRKAPKGNVGLSITQIGDTIEITAKLEKSGKLSSDPNIGFVTGVSAILRQFNWSGAIVILDHNLPMPFRNGTNKFTHIQDYLGITLKGIENPEGVALESYWSYTKNTEKHATILGAILADMADTGSVIYENHGGTEQGYLKDSAGNFVTIPKKMKKPDLVIYDKGLNAIYIIEGKTSRNYEQGLEQLEDLSDFFDLVKGLYLNCKIESSLIIFGMQESKNKDNKKLSCRLSLDGTLFQGEAIPFMLSKVIQRLSNA